MQSFLATGANLSLRKKYIEKELNKLNISPVDRFYLPAEPSIKIKQIRNLIINLSTAPINSKYKATVLLEAEKATFQAQNALLKLLEEPPKNALLYLSAPTSKHLLPTIASRCAIIRLAYSKKADSLPEVFNAELDWLAQKIKIETGTAFQLAEKYGANRQTADNFIQSALIYVRREYLKGGAFYGTKYPALTIVRKLQLSRKLIASNVSPRQVLENLFLNFS